MMFLDETTQLKNWIEKGSKQGECYSKINYYWERYDFLHLRLGIGIGFVVGGGLGIIGLLFF